MVGKYFISVRHYRLREAMKSHHCIQQQFGHLQCYKGVFQRKEMRVHGKFVNHHQNAIESFRNRQSFDEIHGYVLPTPSKNR
jgi:hypothetical protein